MDIKRAMCLCISLLVLFAIVPVTGMMNGEKNTVETQTKDVNYAHYRDNENIDWWPMFQHDLRHTGSTTSNAPLTNTTVWTYTGVPDDDDFQDIIVADGKIIVRGYHLSVWSNDGKLWCFDYESKSFLWERSLFNLINNPVYYNGRVYVSAISDENEEYYGRLFCLDGETGENVWMWAAPDGVSYDAPLVDDGNVYFGVSMEDMLGNTGSAFVCLNANNGSFIWWNYFNGVDIRFSIPAVVNNSIYVTGDLINGPAKVYRFNAINGSMIWSRNHGDGADTPTVAYGKVYLASYYNKVYCLDAEGNGDGTTDLLWSFNPSPSTHFTGSPAVAYGNVYVGAHNNKFYCLDAEDGATVWSYVTGGEISYCSAVIAQEHVYAGSLDKKLYCVDALGNGDGTTNLIWTYLTDSYSIEPSALVDGKLFAIVRGGFGTGDPKLHCFEDPLVASISTLQTQVHQYSYFVFNVTVTNNGDSLQTVSVWTAARIPSGTIYEPIKGPVTITLNPGETKTYVNVQQWVGHIMLGTYRYYVRVGETYPGPVLAEDYWDAEVIP